MIMNYKCNNPSKISPGKWECVQQHVKIGDWNRSSKQASLAHASPQTCEPSDVVRPLPQADGYLLAFSVTDSASFEALASMLPRLPFAAPCLPVATKADLGELAYRTQSITSVIQGILSFKRRQTLSSYDIYAGYKPCMPRKKDAHFQNRTGRSLMTQCWNFAHSGTCHVALLRQVRQFI